MNESVKYAILDTDFVSKANIIKSNDRVLADEVLDFPGYRFYCHQKMKDELGDHGTRSAQEWLEKKSYREKSSVMMTTGFLRNLQMLPGAMDFHIIDLS